MYYIGGTAAGLNTDSDIVYKIDTKNPDQISTPVGTIPIANFGSSSVQLGNTSYIFGGWLAKRAIVAFHTDTHDSETLGMIEFPSSFFTEVKDQSFYD